MEGFEDFDAPRVDGVVVVGSVRSSRGPGERASVEAEAEAEAEADPEGRGGREWRPGRPELVRALPLSHSPAVAHSPRACC